MSGPATPQRYPLTSPAATSARDQPDAQNQACSFNTDDEVTAFQSLLNDLPQPVIPNFYTGQLHHMPEGSKDSGWQQCLKAVEKHDADLCQAYREQIDTLLVFAGLFSAVVTAFAVESYQWLLDDPADTSADLLRDVVRLLAQNLNQTALPAHPTAARLSDAVVTRINVFWFLSLSISLSAALVGILCKQWLREFERDVGQSPETALAVRHIRYQGLGYWQVGSLVSSVPILLQVSLALFLTGIVELLWRLHIIVAICVTAVAVITLAFYMMTTLLPLIQYTYIILRLSGWFTPENGRYSMTSAFALPQCAFKSAQAWVALRMAQPVLEYLIRTFCFDFMSSDDSPGLVLRPPDSWITFDINWMKRRDHIHWGPKSAYKTLAWVAANIDERHLTVSIWQCAWARWLQTLAVKDDHGPAYLDIGCIAQAFPEPIRLGIETSANIRAQAAIFRCSLHTTLSVNTAVEMVLRIAPVIGVDSRWTCEALETVRAIYRDQSICLSEGMAFGLLRLAKLQTQAIVQRQIATGYTENSSSQGTAAFYQVFELLYTGATEFHEGILPAMCALALQWVRSHPGQISTRPPAGSNADYANRMICAMLSYYTSSRCDPPRLRHYPGIIFPARLARIVVDLHPYLARFCAEFAPYEELILQNLLEISSANASNVPVGASHCGTAPVTPSVPSVPGGEGDLSTAATADRIPPVAPVYAEEGRSSSSAMPAHIAIIHTDAVRETDLNSATADSPTTDEL